METKLPKESSSSDFEKFDTSIGKVLSISHDELKRREKKYQQERRREKRVKTSPASHAPDASS
jgi:hypothetical protein